MASEGSGPLLILSQVVLSLQLPFAVFPLVMFTGDRGKMGHFANPPWVQGAGVVRRGGHRRLNVWLLYQTAITYL